MSDVVDADCIKSKVHIEYDDDDYDDDGGDENDDAYDDYGEYVPFRC